MLLESLKVVKERVIDRFLIEKWPVHCMNNNFWMKDAYKLSTLGASVPQFWFYSFKAKFASLKTLKEILLFFVTMACKSAEKIKELRPIEVQIE